MSPFSGFAPQVPGRIPSLDGLRCISVMLVVIGHVVESGRNFPPSLYGLRHLGNLGVRCFFIISGFLITTLLLKELDRNGVISLKYFYLRRALRIFPANFVYIGVVAILHAFGLALLMPGDLIYAFTYTMNYYPEHYWSLNHLWSLAVEEQFYLVWPPVLVLAGPRRALRGAAMVILVCPFVRAWMWYVAHSHPSDLTRQFQAVADALAMGCLLAGMHNWLTRRHLYMRLLSSNLFWLVPLFSLVAAVAFTRADAGWFYVYGQSIANLGIMLAIDRCIRFPQTPLGRLLNSRPFVFVGVLSYSLYLWQELFLNTESHAWPTLFPINVALTFLVAYLSYKLVEQPFLRLKPHPRNAVRAIPAKEEN